MTLFRRKKNGKEKRIQVANSVVFNEREKKKKRGRTREQEKKGSEMILKRRKSRNDVIDNKINE